MYDAIIVGARCAGSPLGMLLAREGHRVLVVDRDTFPSDTLSTSFFQEGASAALARWGLYDRLVATDLPSGPVSMHLGGGMLTVPLPTGDFPAVAPRRTYLDKILVDAAREAGAEVREGFSVQELRRDGAGRVTGIRGRNGDGESVVEEARVVIGADGRNSFVARQVEAPEYNAVEPTTCGYYTYFTGVDAPGHELHYNGRHAFFLFPTNDGQVCIAAEAPIEAWNEYRSDPAAYLFGRMEEYAPALYERVREARPVERWYGMQGRRSFFRRPYGDGWALAGDAGYLKDPITGRGCDDAFRDAESLADGLHRWLSGAAGFEETMEAHQRERDAVAMPLYQQTCFLAEMHEVTPEFLQQAAGRLAPA